MHDAGEGEGGRVSLLVVWCSEYVWVCTRAGDVMVAMTKARVPSGPILSTADICREPQYLERRMVHYAAPPAGGKALAMSAILPVMSRHVHGYKGLGGGAFSTQAYTGEHPLPLLHLYWHWHWLSFVSLVGLIILYRAWHSNYNHNSNTVIIIQRIYHISYFISLLVR